VRRFGGRGCRRAGAWRPPRTKWAEAARREVGSRAGRRTSAACPLLPPPHRKARHRLGQRLHGGCGDASLSSGAREAMQLIGFMQRAVGMLQWPVQWVRGAFRRSAARLQVSNPLRTRQALYTVPPTPTPDHVVPLTRTEACGCAWLWCGVDPHPDPRDMQERREDDKVKGESKATRVALARAHIVDHLLTMRCPSCSQVTGSAEREWRLGELELMARGGRSGLLHPTSRWAQQSTMAGARQNMGAVLPAGLTDVKYFTGSALAGGQQRLKRGHGHRRSWTFAAACCSTARAPSAMVFSVRYL
jgi:hypothetical protein